MSEPVDLPEEFAIERRRGNRRTGGRSTLAQDLVNEKEGDSRVDEPSPRARHRGILEDQFGQSADQLRSFRQLLTAVRWVTFVVACLLSTVDNFDQATVIGVILVGANAIIRTFRPIVYRTSDPEGWFGILLELTMHIGIVIATGATESPFVFCLSAAIVAAGLVRGFTAGVTTAAVSAASIALFAISENNEVGALRILLGAGQLILIGAISGYGNRLFGEARAQAATAISRIGRLAEVNNLLAELHQAAQALPVSLDLDETVNSTAARIRSMLHPDVIVILLTDETTNTWRTSLAEGARLEQRYTDADLPLVAREAATATKAHIYENINQTANVSGFNSTTTNGIYAPLVARGRLVGVLAVEAKSTSTIGHRHLGLVDGLAEQLALAIDNARWFGRIRVVGAEEERLRIARDLHDRVGQSLAYLAFELDRISNQPQALPVADELHHLRQDIRKVVTEVRETLYDLRTDVTEASDLPTTLLGFLDRVRSRTGLQVISAIDSTTRPPLLQEREIWRIATEAITNTERHSQASKLEVRYSSDESGVSLEIIDDGKGFAMGEAGRVDSYGMAGMRERADAIGAALEVRSAPGQGTNIRCVLNRRTLRSNDDT